MRHKRLFFRPLFVFRSEPARRGVSQHRIRGMRLHERHHGRRVVFALPFCRLLLSRGLVRTFYSARERSLRFHLCLRRMLRYGNTTLHAAAMRLHRNEVRRHAFDGNFFSGLSHDGNGVLPHLACRNRPFKLPSRRNSHIKRRIGIARSDCRPPSGKRARPYSRR